MNSMNSAVKRIIVAILLVATSLSMTEPANAQAANVTTSDSTDRLIIKYKREPVGGATARAKWLDSRMRDLQLIGEQRGVRLSYLREGILSTYLIKISQRMSLTDVEALATNIEASDNNIEYAEPDRIMFPTFIPNDPRFNEQWHYQEPLGGINLPAAWDLSTGAGVKVAVIDTGFRPHADLAANLLGGYDFISTLTMANDGNGRDSDASDPGDGCGLRSSWHGTHVAGTVAAVTNNGFEVAGVAFGAKVVPIRVLGCGGGNESDIAAGIVWAAGGPVAGVPTNSNAARVLNLSLSRSGVCGATFQNAINAARARGAVVVVSAGNSNVDAATEAPSSCAGVITVGASTRSGGKAFYSNFGDAVDVFAPGGDFSSGVLSTFNTGISTPGLDSSDVLIGTSMASPHVAGVAALMLARNNALTPDQIESILKATTRPLPVPCSQCRAGIVNALAAVNNAVSVSVSETLPWVNGSTLSFCGGQFSIKSRTYSFTLSGGPQAVTVSPSNSIYTVTNVNWTNGATLFPGTYSTTIAGTFRPNGTAPITITFAGTGHSSTATVQVYEKLMCP